MHLRHKRTSSWFLIITAIVIGFILILVIGVITSEVAGWQRTLEDMGTEREWNWIESEKFAHINALTDMLNGSDWGDYFLCASGTIYVPESLAESPVCSAGDFTPGYDGLDDRMDNNDFQPGYASSGADLTALLQPWSRLYDDDADARTHSEGFVAPNETVSAVSLTDRNRGYVLQNANNQVYPLPFASPNAKIRIELLANGDTEGNVRLAIFSTPSTGKVQAVREVVGNFSLSGGVSYSGELLRNGQISNGGIGQPEIVNVGEAWMDVALTNSGTSPIGYRVSLWQDGLPVYTVPVRDRITDYPGATPRNGYMREYFHKERDGSYGWFDFDKTK